MQKYTFLHGRMGCIMFGGAALIILPNQKSHVTSSPPPPPPPPPPPRCPNFNHSGKERAVLPESTSKLAELQKVWDGMCPSPPPGLYAHAFLLLSYTHIAHP
jgi:hypothetical protein